MADYGTSTQRNKWLLNVSDLADRRLHVNARAAELLKTKGSTKVELTANGDEAAQTEIQLSETSRDLNVQLPEPLSVEEETVIRKFYEVKIQQVCRAFSFSSKVQATAIMYFKRFFLSWSVMEQDPKNIMLTCVYVACKIEESYVSAEQLANGIHQDPKILLANEIAVLQSLQFEFITFSPHRSVHGFLKYLQKLPESEVARLDEEGFQALTANALKRVEESMLTDTPLLFPPGQIALAAIAGALRESEAPFAFHGFLEAVVARVGREVLQDLEEVTHRIEHMIAADARPPLDEEVKKIDRKLKYCRNPGLLLEEQKKRERKERHKAKRSSNPAPLVREEAALPDKKRRKSVGVET